MDLKSGEFAIFVPCFVKRHKTYMLNFSAESAPRKRKQEQNLHVGSMRLSADFIHKRVGAVLSLAEIW